MADKTEEIDFLDAAMNGGSAEPSKEEGKDNNSPDINKGEEGSEGTEGEEEVNQEELQKVTNELKTTFSTFTSSDISDEDKILREDFLKEYKGAKFDKDGNILNEAGEIVAKFEDIAKDLAKQEEATFDDKGNQVDAEGNIIATKEQLEANSNEINLIAKELGYQFQDDKGNPKVYPKGLEGQKELTKDIVDYETQKAQEQFFNSNPVLREVSKHLLAGKDLSDFDKPVDYSSVDVKNLTEEQNRNYIKQSLLAEGMSEERANKIVSLYKKPELESATQEALDVLTKVEEQRQEQRDLDLQKVEEAKAKETEQYWEKVNSVIKEGKLDDFNIPQQEKEEFFKYLAIPVKDGLSQDQIDFKQSSMDKKLKEAYYRWKNYDVSSVIRDEVNNRTVNNLRSKIKRTRELSGNKSINKGNSRNIEVSLDTIS